MIADPDPQGLVHIGGTTLTPIQHHGRRVVTFRQIDAVHQRPEGTTSRNFRANKHHLIKGDDYWVVSPDEIRRTNPNADIPSQTRSDIVVLTESGYLMVVKSLTDDLAWQVQRALVTTYFQTAKPSVSEMAVMLQDPAFMAKAFGEMIAKAQQLEGQVRELAPKAEFTDQVAGSHGSMTVKKLAQLCGTGQNRMFKWLRSNGYLQKDNVPYQKHVDRGLFELRVLTVNQGDKTFTRTQPLVTGKGLVHLQHKFAGMVNTALELDANPSGGWV